MKNEDINKVSNSLNEEILKYNGKRVMLKDTGEHGEAWEYLEFASVISVFVDGEKKCRIIDFDNIIFL